MTESIYLQKLCGEAVDPVACREAYERLVRAIAEAGASPVYGFDGEVVFEARSPDAIRAELFQKTVEQSQRNPGFMEELLRRLDDDLLDAQEAFGEENPQ